MPKFRDGPVLVDRRFSGDALKRLHDVGHGHRINLADDSLDIPDRDNRVTLPFPGSASELLVSIFRLIPVERTIIMQPDADLEPSEDPGSFMARYKFMEAYEQLHDDLGVLPRPEFLCRQTGPNGEPGFYDEAHFTTRPESTTYFLPVEPLPFACASLIVGHSQRAS